MSHIIVLGSGAWGTAIALSLHRRGGHQVTLWAHSPEAASEINEPGENTLFLPGFPIPPAITVTGDNAAAGDAEIVVSVVPSEFLRSTFARVRPHLHPGQIIVSATKGVEDHTFLRMTEVIASCLTSSPDPASQGFSPDKNPAASMGTLQLAEIRNSEGGGGFNPRITPEESTRALAPEASPSLTFPIGAFSGPSFALEVAQGQPTAVTVAFSDPEITARIQQEFSSETLRLYTSSDVIGVELGGALKNVIAIAAGVAAGVGLGYNSAAALITRGIAEITRLAVACGGRRETLAGLSGIGDLVLTCTGTLSRNRTVGHELGQGRKLPEILQGLGGKVAEGVFTTRAALGLARKHGIEMPITQQMELILNEGKDPREAIKDLMLRPGKDEQ
jgi:glycerol-3-phosphate dehydrogenase (NAD(P)+)